MTTYVTTDIDKLARGVLRLRGAEVYDILKWESSAIKLRKVADLWVKRYASEATYELLIDRLKEHGFQNDADELKMYILMKNGKN